MIDWMFHYCIVFNRSSCKAYISPLPRHTYATIIFLLQGMIAVFKSNVNMFFVSFCCRVQEWHTEKRQIWLKEKQQFWEEKKIEITKVEKVKVWAHEKKQVWKNEWKSYEVRCSAVSFRAYNSRKHLFSISLMDG